MDARAPMMGSSSMQKAGRLKWLLLVLAGPLLFFGFKTSGIGVNLAWTLPSAQATDKGVNSSGGACTRNSQGPSFGGSIAIGSNEIVCGDVTSFGGSVAVKGELRGNVTAFNSNTIIAGEVTGNLTLFGGTIVLTNSSQVHGHIDLYGTRELNVEGSQLDGAITDHTHNQWFPGRMGEFKFPFWSLLVWAILGIGLITLLPEHVMFVRTTVTTKTRRSIIIGLLSILLAPAVLVVLVALILPIPLALILAVGLIAAWVLGTVAVSWIIGERILRAVAPQYNTRRIDVMVGLTVLVLVGSIPYIGWLISFGVGLLGLGAVFLSRFGTRLYSQPKQPLTL
jgi:cytoskeletal protein CcmA (bactofilin family)